VPAGNTLPHPLSWQAGKRGLPGPAIAHKATASGWSCNQTPPARRTGGPGWAQRARRVAFGFRHTESQPLLAISLWVKPGARPAVEPV